MNPQHKAARGMPTIAARTRSLPLEPLPDAPIVTWARRFDAVARIITLWLLGGVALGMVAQLLRWVLA